MRIIGRLALLCVVSLAAMSSEGQPAVRQVLILQSLARGNIVGDSFTGHFRLDLDRVAGTPVNVVDIVVGPTGLVGAPEESVVGYVRSTFPRGLEPDLIVTIGAPAAIFARKYRQQLFPDAPLLLTCVDQRFLDATPLAANEASVAVVNDFSLIVDDTLELLPETKQIVMVVGAGPLGAAWRQTLEKDFARFRNRVTFLWSEGVSLAELLRRCAALPAGSAIYFLWFGNDNSGAAYPDDRVLAELHATANAPLVGPHSVMLGLGIVGGRLMDIEALATNAAAVAIRLLNGEPAHLSRLPPARPGRPVFDWRELKRWNVPEGRLPANSDVRFRAPSPWREYRSAILAALAALIIQTLLIIGLVYERRARHRAEMDSRRHLALAADVSRRQTMSALTNSISHELGQPLNSMIFNAQALAMMVAANQADPASVAEIVSDIQAQGQRATEIMNRHRTMLRSRAVEKKAVDAEKVVRESLALVAHDMQQRQIESVVELPSTSCGIEGDEVLLQQVIVNLVMNAMDAMSETAPAMRRLVVRSETTRDDIEISVRDSGSGLSPEIATTLFTPFVTSKSHGLGIGLTIARSIVDAHGGTIDARNNPDGGATFTVRLPCNVAYRRARTA